MDETHLRFFDRKTAGELLERSGFQIVARSDDGYFPLGWTRTRFPLVARRLDRFIVNLFPGVFAWQFLMVAQPHEEHLEAR